MGSGMPRGLWRRVCERFAPAGVVEFYASTEGEVVLANVSGHKIGAMGRPLPGLGPRTTRGARPRGRPARGDALAGSPASATSTRSGSSSSEVDADVNPRSRRRCAASSRPDDAWVATGDLFRRDADGDFWLVDAITSLIRTDDGPGVPDRRARRAVDPPRGRPRRLLRRHRRPARGHAVAIGAITLREGRDVTREPTSRRRSRR